MRLTRLLTPATCAPPAEAPEAPAALLLPLSMAAGAGVVLVARNRDRTAPLPS